MKLLSKFSRVNVIATIVVLLISGVVYYVTIRSLLISQLDDDLKGEEFEIVNFVRENDQLPEPSDDEDEQEYFISSDRVTTRNFTSVDVFDKSSRKNISYRQIQFHVNAAGKGYNVAIRKSQRETEDIIEFIFKITSFLIVVLLLTLFLINRLILSKLWKPFHSTLEEIKQFNLPGKTQVKLPSSNIDEFTELNTAVDKMINRVNQDYNEIKNFTENASHEIQTPLAIIKSKLELLSQSENLKEEQMNTIQSIYEAVNRLSKLNQSLILLTKIDNQQFKEKEEVNIGVILNDNITYYEELIASKNIVITKYIHDDMIVEMNETLAGILICNLITNAIKYNIDNGSIEIRLDSHQLSISNTGAPLDCDPLEMFERFKKDKVTSESLGLGLSIVKKICERYHVSINYSYSNRHTVTVDF